MSIVSYYKIADLNLRISRCEPPASFAPFESTQHSDIDIDIECECSDILGAESTTTELSHIIIDGVAHIFSRYDEGYTFSLVGADRCATTLRYNSSSNKVIIEPCDDREKLQFLLWVAFALVAIKSGVVPIHSSVVTHRESATLFLGDSGAGKSTQSRLWIEHIDGCSLLNDDSPILRIVDGVVMVYGSPWSGKTRCYINRCDRVKAFVRVVKSKENTIAKSDTLHSFASLYPSMPPIFACDDALSNMLVNFISDTISLSATYRLRCTKDLDAVQITFNELYGEENSQ